MEFYLFIFVCLVSDELVRLIYSHTTTVCVRMSFQTTLKKRACTHCSGHGRRKGAIVYVGVAVHVAHHDVARVGWVWMAFTVHVLMFD